MKAKSEYTYKKAFISGASSGIGEALARLLAKKGIHLILSARNEKSLHELANELSCLVKVDIYAIDLLDPLKRKFLIEKIKEHNPDLIINNAGFGIYGNPLDSSLEEQRAMIEINAIVPFEITYEMAQFWRKKQQTGTILNVSSVAAELLFPLSNVYASSKAFLTHFSRTLDRELRGSKIRILTSAPGQVNTQFATRASKKVKRDFHQKGLMSSQYAAHLIWKQIVSKKSYQVINKYYRFCLFIAKITPKTLVENFLFKKIHERIS